MKGIVKEYLFVMLMPSHSDRVTLGHIEFHLPIGFPIFQFGGGGGGIDDQCPII